MRVVSSLPGAKRIFTLLRNTLVALIAFSLIAASLQSRPSARASQPDSKLPNLAAGQVTGVGESTDNETLTFSNTSFININDRGAAPTSGAATPFPSDINVSGIIGNVSKVTATIIGYNHQWPDDVDVLLVGPGGQTVFLMSDVGGNVDAMNATVTFDDNGATHGDQPIVTGTYKPANFAEENPTAGTDTYPAPAPPLPYGTTLSVFNDTNANGVWKLFVADDENGMTGNISGGWSISITNSITAQNTTAMELPDSGAASLYPSTTEVSGLGGVVTNVAVILNNFTHTAPDDLDLLLVAPGGRSAVIFSDAGGANAVSNLILNLDDNAVNSLPDSGQLVSGNYKPANFEAGDPFPAPAPANATGADFSVFNGINPNGTWRLYAVDDAGGNAGGINGGWGIAINTSTTACNLTITPPLQVFPITGGSSSFNINPTASGCAWTATSDVSFINITSNSNGEGNGIVGFTVDANMGQGRTGTISVSTATFTRTFSIQQPSGCPFSLSQETMHFGGIGGAGNVGVTASGNCGWITTTKDNWITINNGNGTGNGAVTFTIAPNTSGIDRAGTLTIGSRALTIMQARANGSAVLDFDADGKSDYVVTRPASGLYTWHVQQSINGVLSRQWGASDTVPVPGDYDGDGKCDLAVWNATGAPSVFYILRSETNTFQAIEWGLATDDPKVTQDFDGDGKADPAVTRYDSGTGLNWYIRETASGNLRAVQFGAMSDVPVRGDFDGDGKADIAVYRRGTGSPANTFFVLRSSDGMTQAATFGNYDSDYIVPADFDGDGKTDYAVWRGRNQSSPDGGTWYWLQSSDSAFRAFNFGLAGTDQPAPGDYDGDGKTDQAVWRPGAGGTFYVNRSTANFTAVSWGISGDLVPAFSLQAR